MSGYRTKPGWVIPETIEPEDYHCVSIRVPNNLEHIAAFWAAIGTLGWYNAWAKDEAKRGKDIAAFWRDLIQEAKDNAYAGGCETVRGIRWNDNEQLEYTEDEETWTPINPRVMMNRHDTFESGVDEDGVFRHEPTGKTDTYFEVDNGSQSRGLQLSNDGAILPHHLTIWQELVSYTYWNTRLKLSSSSANVHRMNSNWANSVYGTHRGKLLWEMGSYDGYKTLIQADVGTSLTPRIGFLGASPTARQTLAGNVDTPLKQLLTAMANFGFITDSTTQVLSPAPEDQIASAEITDCEINFKNQAGTTVFSVDITACVDARIEAAAQEWEVVYDMSDEAECNIWQFFTGQWDDSVIPGATCDVTDTGINTTGEMYLRLYWGGDEYNISEVVIGYTSSPSGTYLENYLLARIFSSSGQEDEYFSYTPAGTTTWDTGLTYPAATYIDIGGSWEFENSGDGLNPEMTITSVTIRGTGAEPPKDPS